MWTYRNSQTVRCDAGNVDTSGHKAIIGQTSQWGRRTVEKNEFGEGNVMVVARFGGSTYNIQCSRCPRIHFTMERWICEVACVRHLPRTVAEFRLVTQAVAKTPHELGQWESWTYKDLHIEPCSSVKLWSQVLGVDVLVVVCNVDVLRTSH